MAIVSGSASNRFAEAFNRVIFGACTKSFGIRSNMLPLMSTTFILDVTEVSTTSEGSSTSPHPAIFKPPWLRVPLSIRSISSLDKFLCVDVDDAPQPMALVLVCCFVQIALFPHWRRALDDIGGTS